MGSEEESRLLAAVLALAAVAQLAKWRIFESLVPDRLDPLRREIEVTTGCWQLAGALALVVPRLRQPARWVNVPLQAGTLVAAVNSVRKPSRLRRYRLRTSAVQSVLSGARIATSVVALISIWWVTRSRSAR
jgi:uncharacterized membrane protein